MLTCPLYSFSQCWNVLFIVLNRRNGKISKGRKGEAIFLEVFVKPLHKWSSLFSSLQPLLLSLFYVFVIIIIIVIIIITISITIIIIKINPFFSLSKLLKLSWSPRRLCSQSLNQFSQPTRSENDQWHLVCWLWWCTWLQVEHDSIIIWP